RAVSRWRWPAIPRRQHRAREPSRGKSSGSSHQHWENLWQRFRREQHGFESGDVGLRRKRIHALCAADTWNCVHAERGDLARGQSLHELRIVERIQKRDKRAAFTQQSGLVDGWFVKLDGEIGLAQQRRGVSNNAGAGPLEIRVRK